MQKIQKLTAVPHYTKLIQPDAPVGGLLLTVQHSVPSLRRHGQPVAQSNCARRSPHLGHGVEHVCLAVGVTGTRNPPCVRVMRHPVRKRRSSCPNIAHDHAHIDQIHLSGAAPTPVYTVCHRSLSQVVGPVCLSLCPCPYVRVSISFCVDRFALPPSLPCHCRTSYTDLAAVHRFATSSTTISPRRTVGVVGEKYSTHRTLIPL